MGGATTSVVDCCDGAEAMEVADEALSAPPHPAPTTAITTAVFRRILISERYPVLGYRPQSSPTGGVEKSIHSERHRQLAVLLRELRKASGLRQADVALALGEPQSFVAKYEAGERRLDLIELEQVSDVLGITVEELVGRWRALGRRH